MGQVCQENLEREIMNSFRFRPSSSPWHLSLHPRRLLLSPNHPGAASRPEGRFGQAELSRIGPPPASRPTCLDRFLQIHLQDHGRQSRWHQCELELNEFWILSSTLCNTALLYEKFHFGRIQVLILPVSRRSFMILMLYFSGPSSGGEQAALPERPGSGPDQERDLLRRCRGNAHREGRHAWSQQVELNEDFFCVI